MTDADPSPARRRVLPPHQVRRDFLAPSMVVDLLAYADANQARFKPATTGYGAGGGVRPDRRVSLMLREFGPLRDAIEAKVRPLAPVLAEALKVRPFEVSRVELELVAHGDGAFFARHIDTLRQAVTESAATMRLLSGVYYFHALPKAFSGGALRLHEIPLAAGDAHFVDIEPENNSLVFFPSWMPHEVMPVSVPSRRFMDSRFAINCWFHRKAG